MSISPFLEEDVEENLWETNKNVQFVKMFNLLAMQLMFSFLLVPAFTFFKSSPLLCIL